MKQNNINSENITKRFDKELKQLLMSDLKSFKACKGQFLKNKSNKQEKLLVA